MTEFERPDPRERPDDPAGTKPKVDSESLLPAIREPLLPPPADVDGTAVEDGDEPDLLPERVGAVGTPAALGAGIDPPEAPRFQFLLGALFALGLAALVGVVMIAIQGKQNNGPDFSWSPWHPTSGDVPGQIATHVAGEYHLSTGDQLVAVTGGPLEVQGFPLTIALRQPVSQGGDIKLIDGKGVLYRMCGLGKDCSISIGKPSTAREFLIRREALELALYTFHYTDADNVVAFLPPAILKPLAKTKNAAQTAKPKTVTQAMFFRRSDVGTQISQPLSATLTRQAPLPSTVTSSPDAAGVDQLTEPRMFRFSLSPSNQDNRAFLVLQQG